MVILEIRIIIVGALSKVELFYFLGELSLLGIVGLGNSLTRNATPTECHRVFCLVCFANLNSTRGESFKPRVFFVRLGKPHDLNL